MTDRRNEQSLHDLRVLVADLRADELPPALCSRALRFYAASRTADTAEERFLALYNGLGVLMGFPEAQCEAERLLGNVGQALSAARADGDTQTASARFPYSDAQLDLLAAALRRRCCESIGRA